MTTHIEDGYHKKRAEVTRKLEGVKAHYMELVDHREDVNRSIEVLERETLRIEGELRLLEELTMADHKLCQDQKIIKK